MDLINKLAVLGESARYDVSCSTSGVVRENRGQGIGNTTLGGICHTFTEDGRCVSLLKVLMTNVCCFDCAYCANRRSNNVPRAAFTVEEAAELTMGFYLRNYIEGLFLSSGVERSPDHTMEQLIAVCRRLRQEHHFHGYIHVKAIPGASAELIRTAGLYADRLSVNIELPSEQSLKLLAPQKSREQVLAPMKLIAGTIATNRDERTRFTHTPRYAPAGQSTQLIVSASPESDHQILRLSASLYEHCHLKRVYYSAYIPVNDDTRLPAPPGPDMLREHRLYQADWLMRVYGFDCGEIVDERAPELDRRLDPKCAWALRNLHWFPVEVNRADYEALLRVPGIGIRSARRILATRRSAPLRMDDLPKLGVVMKRAQYFITCHGRGVLPPSVRPAALRAALEAGDPARVTQPDLFGEL